jgi:hypothetical protein
LRIRENPEKDREGELLCSIIILSPKIPENYKGMRLTLQVSGEDGRPVAQSLKGITGLKEMDRVIAEGTVATSSTPENLVINVTKLHRAPKQ